MMILRELEQHEEEEEEEEVEVINEEKENVYKTPPSSPTSSTLKSSSQVPHNYPDYDGLEEKGEEVRGEGNVETDGDNANTKYIYDSTHISTPSRRERFKGMKPLKKKKWTSSPHRGAERTSVVTQYHMSDILLGEVHRRLLSSDSDSLSSLLEHSKQQNLPRGSQESIISHGGRGSTSLPPTLSFLDPAADECLMQLLVYMGIFSFMIYIFILV